MKKRLLSITLCLFLLFGLTACGDGGFKPAQKSFDKDLAVSAPSSDQVIAQNSKYSLQYDSQTAGVKIVDLATGTQWGTTPVTKAEQQAAEGSSAPKKRPIVKSPIRVSYTNLDVNGGGIETVNAYTDAYSLGRINYKSIENGVTIEYYFDDSEIMVPVDYVLKEDYVSISIDTTKIQENNIKVVDVSLAPFLCSVENDSEDSYLFMPSGSGALVDVASYSTTGLAYEAYIYGDDLSMERDYDTADEIDVRLPVYGYKNGNVGGFAIIDSGAETAKICSTSGNTTYGFSTVYPSFQLRGHSNHFSKAFDSMFYTNIFPNNMIEGTVSVRFYPLANEDADYNTMADIYRDYLTSECGLKENANDKAMNVSIIGGSEITKSFLGIPYKTLFATTTVEQSQSIVSELAESIDNLSVKLKGFGTSGADIGKIGGGYKLGDNLGSASQLKDFSEYCGQNGVDLYFDYDLVKFNNSGSGFSYSRDVVMNCGYIKADQYVIDKAIRANTTDLKYRLLSPSEFGGAVNKTITANQKFGLAGVSLDTLSSMSYSDYSNYTKTVKYNSKNGFGEAVSQAVTQLKENNQKYMASQANAYAAVLADIITDTPISSNDGYAFIEDIPFYTMVFKGYVPMTTESVNLSKDPQRVILGAVESGIGLNYTLTNSWDNSLIDAVNPYFYSTVYSSTKEDMISVYNNLSDYYDSIKGAKITSNTIVSSGVHCTTFDNGIAVYVNYNETPAQTPVGEIGALNYVIMGGAAQ